MFSRKISVYSLLTVVLLLSLSAAAGAQEKPKTLETTAKGKGTIKVGREQFQLHTVILKLKEEGKLEMILVSDISLFFEGSWSWADSSGKVVDLKIHGGATGAVDGGGKLFLRDDGESIARMTLQAANKFRKTIVNVQFTAD